MTSTSRIHSVSAVHAVSVASGSSVDEHGSASCLTRPGVSSSSTRSTRSVINPRRSSRSARTVTMSRTRPASASSSTAHATAVTPAPSTEAAPPTTPRPGVQKPSLGAAVDEFLQWLELDRHRSAGTVAEYRADLERFCAYAAEHGVDDAVRPRPRRRNGSAPTSAASPGPRPKWPGSRRRHR